MILPLKDFQEIAVADLAVEARLARNEVEAGGKAQTLILSAPTGSGKTVMATSCLEALVEGDESRAADPNATFLWITDQRELNEQTKRKFAATSNVFGNADLITIENDFDEPLFLPGKVYFLNTQKLGRDTKLVTFGDDRDHVIWQTVANTAADRAGSFWVVIDEAHKGMGETTKARTDATTIVQKFVKGSPGDGLPSIPLVLGISATPDRFKRLLEGTSRISRPVSVSVDAVRSSGLLKDTITLYHPEETQPST